MTLNRRNFALGTAAAGLAAGTARAASVDPAVLADQVLRTEMKTRRIPGLQAAVVKDGRIVFQRALGIANLQYGVPVTDQTIFSINSCTKSFTGVAMMQLVEAGQVSLDAPISTYLNDLPPAWRAIPVRQLLGNVSGLPNAINNASGEAIAETEADVWAALAARPVLFAPGERNHYCQTNYALLLRVVEKLTGRPFPEVIAERQLRVAGAAHTGFGDSRDIIPSAAQNYRMTYPVKLAPGELANNHHSFPTFLRAGAGMNSTAGDMARWLTALQSRRLLKEPASLKSLWTAQTLNDGQAGEWALGWTPLARKQHPAVGCTGGGRAAFYVYPDDGVAVVILTNLAGGTPEDFADQLAQPFVPEFRLNGVSALRVALQARDFRDVAGTYEALKRERPDFEISEIDLNNWAYRLMRTEWARQSVELFKLATVIFPNSGNAWDSLGDGYAWIGEKSLSIASYERSLALDPGNSNAVAQLKKLRGE